MALPEESEEDRINLNKQTEEASSLGPRPYLLNFLYNEFIVK